MTTPRVSIASLQVARSLYDVVEHQILPDTGIESNAFWSALAGAVTELGPTNKRLLQKRDALQVSI